MSESKKMYLSQKNLTLFIIANMGMTSSTIPMWLLEINHGYVSDVDFENASEFERPDRVIELLENTLTAVLLHQIIENDFGELAYESNMYEAARRTYIETVQQRMDTVYDLINTAFVNVKVKTPFEIFPAYDVNIEFEKLDRTRAQKELARAMKLQAEKDKKESKVLN